MRGCVTIFAFLLGIVVACAEEPPARLRVPDAAGQKQARAAIQEVFGAEIAKAKTVTARRAVAIKMLAVANDPKEATGNRWVLYVQARSLALAAGDIPLLVQALDDLCKTFAVSRRETCAESIEKVKTVPPGGAKPMLDLISATADDAVNADEYSLAVKLLGQGAHLAQLGKEAAMARRFESRIRAVNEQAKLFEAAKTDDDALGKFLCFRKGDWERGLPLLAKSKDEDLALMARKDLRNPKEAKEQGDLGIAWVDFAEKSKGPERIMIMRRALYWGALGIEGLTGLAKAKIEQRIGKAISEIEEADAKDGIFSLYAGMWRFRFENTANPVEDYTIDLTGKVVNSSNLRGTLSYSKGELLFVSPERIERFRLVGNTIHADRFAPPVDYPTKIKATGVATRLK